MGFGNSKYYNSQEYDSHMGYVPRKLKEEDTKYHPSRYQYIVGDGRLLKFDTETYELTKVPVSQKKINKQTSAEQSSANWRPMWNIDAFKQKAFFHLWRK